MDALTSSAVINYDPLFNELFDNNNNNNQPIATNISAFFQGHGISKTDLHDDVSSYPEIDFSANPIEETQIQFCKLFFKALFPLPLPSTPYSPALRYETNNATPLPEEIWSQILTTLIADEPDWQYMLNFSLTCQQLANIVFSHTLLQHFFKQGPTGLLNVNINVAADVIEKYLKHAPKLTLEFSGDEGLEDKSITDITSCQYDSFTFEQQSSVSHFISDHNIEQLAIHSPDMRTLNLQGCSELTVNAIYYLAAYCHKLTSIHLKDIPILSNAALAALAIQSPNLEHFQLSMKTTPDEAEGPKQPLIEQGLHLLALSCKNIKSIILENCPISDKALQYIAKESSQTFNRLELIDCTHFTFEGLNALLECEHITQFTLQGASPLVDNNFMINMANLWPKLRTCEIRNAAEVKHESLKEFSKLSKNLEILIFDQLDVNFANLTALFTPAKILKELHFASSCKFPLQGKEIAQLFQKYSKNLPNLKVMRFDSDKPLFTYADLRIIATTRPNLLLHLDCLPDEETTTMLQLEFPNFMIDNLA